MQTQPVEDIDAVLGRFQAWAGSRGSSGAKPKIRELSCEEALRSRRYHWKVAENTSESTGATAVPDSAPEPQPAQSAPVVTATRPRKAGCTPSAKAHSRRHGVKKPTRITMPEALGAKSPASVTGVLNDDRPQNSGRFRDALADAVNPRAVVVPSTQPAELTRQVSVSIRFADSERALIRTRAAEAGVTVSAYIRQCALDVEQLRAQVQQMLRTVDRKALAPASTPARGFFARLFCRFFPSATRTSPVGA